MMQLVCNGVSLDLPEGAGLQFTQENPLFAFDNLKCERTTQFKLPATAKNDRVLSVARVPAYSGEGMRRKFAAQLQAGAVVKNGLLYVTAWNGKEYDAVFVTGEMIGLQAIKDAGKISDILNPPGGFIWDAANVQDANAASVYMADVAISRYLTNATPCLPSFDLGGIMNLAYRSVTGRAVSTYTRGFRVITKELKAIGKISNSIQYEGTGEMPSQDFQDPPFANTIAAADMIQNVLSVHDGTILYYLFQDNRYFWRLRQLQSGQKIIVTFPDDFPSNYYLMSIEDKGTPGSDPFSVELATEWFLGDYYFTEGNISQGGIVSHGTPLAGRSVEIPARTPFILMNSNWFDFPPVMPGSYVTRAGFRYMAEEENIYNFSIEIEGSKIEPGDYVRVKDILPDLTITDLLKIHAYLTGTVLNYTDADGVTFDTLDFDMWERLDITPKKIEEEEVRRVFSDFAQRNVIEFDSADDVPSNTRVSTEYTIDNDNLDELKTLATIPFNEGELAAADGFICPRFDAEDTQAKKLPKDGIYIATPQGGKYGERVTLAPNARLQDLCDASTQIIVTARMTVEEYEAITAKTLILCDGTLYVWTARQWQNNAAKFTLARIK